jgi:4-amino-4-deoxy-L-arabinose transferase-like glycosyltransferase
MKFVKKYWLIILIFILAAFLRFYKLDSYPALNADEAAIGYNAYSLLETGKDEHGNPWPIHFQSFNDYKPGLYFYAVLPFIKFIGLNELAVRIPGAALGVLTVLLIYLLAKELFDNEKLSVISALFLAISPWHIHFSRGGWEVNTATFLMLLGVWLLLRATKKPSWISYLSGIIPLALSLYAYHSARIIAPLLGLGVIVFYWREIIKSIKPLLVALGIGIILTLPLARDLFSSNTLSRVAGVGLFADQGPINRINEQRGEHGDLNSLPGKILHNKFVNYGLEFAANWASHYHGLFLFVSGDVIQRNAVPETGEMYLFDIIFVAIGLVAIFAKFSNEWKFIIYWFLIAPIASALTFQSPNALRAENMVVPLVIISALGFSYLINYLKTVKNTFKIIGYILLGSVIVWSFARYLHLYYMHMAKEYPFSSQYGVKELVSYLSENGSKFDRVYVTDKYDQPYILFLFYQKYSPTSFQKNHILTVRDSYGFSTVRDFDKYHFESMDFGKIPSQEGNILMAASPNEVPIGADIVQRVYGSNDYEYFDIIVN